MARCYDRENEAELQVARASPTIREALGAFVEEGAISGMPADEVEEVCELLSSYLDGYAYESLSAAERTLWEREWEADEEAGAFTRLFGPEKIAEHIPRSCPGSWCAR